MKKFYLLLILWVAGLLVDINISDAQIYAPEGLNMPGSWDSPAWTNPPNNLAMAGVQQTGGRIALLTRPSSVSRYQTIFNVAPSGGDVAGSGTPYQFKFSSGPSNNYWANVWGNVTVAFNTLQTYTFSTGSSNNYVTLTNNNWYTVNWENIGYTNNRAIFMQTSGNPVGITNVTQTPLSGSVNDGNNVTVNVTTSAIKSPEEIVYVRYSIDNFTTSALANVSFTGTTGTATIPSTANINGNTIKYYIFSTTVTNPTADYDLYTINYNDNSGAYYSYNVNNTPPIVSSFSPLDNATNTAVNSTLQITFSEAVVKGTGNITIKKSDNTIFQTIDVNSAQVNVATNVVTIMPTSNFDYNTGYYILVDNTALIDKGIPPMNFAGISDPSVWNFTTTPNLLNWVNLQFPATATVIKNYSIANIYAQVYKPTVTDLYGKGNGVSVWIGCNPTNTNPLTWAESAWIPANYNQDVGNNDEYKAIFMGTGLNAGTYYYASRFKYTNNPYQYGGYSATNGGFWDGVTNVSGVLTVQDYTGNLITSNISAITSVPSFPTVNDNITINFDASLGNVALNNLTGNIVYAHTGITTPTGDWQYATTWLDNSAKYLLTYNSGNSYSLPITNIFTYYNATVGTDIQKMSFDFRNTDGSLVAKTADNNDFFIQLYPANQLQLRFNYPTSAIVAHAGDQISVEAESNSADQINLYLDNVIVNSVNALKLDYNVNVGSTPGSHIIKAVAIKAGAANVQQTYSFVVTAQPTVMDLPAGVKDGINYIDAQTVTLVLFAPEKQFVHLIGDFNNWTVDNNYLLNRTTDNTRYWITITGLTPGTEYAFQYLVDGTIRIADPYTDKILDPDNDKYIPASTYPNLKQYPFGLTTEIVSILQTNQPSYIWQVPNFTAPDQNQLVTYELLVRDFSATGDINGVLNKLDYLKTLGINSIELMPVSEFEGNDSWGYNPDFYFAFDKAYGTKQALKTFIDECHKKGIATIIDMVLNHSYEQSPMVRLYYDQATGDPTPNNPWFNVVAPNPNYSWGSDFNHERQATKDFVDRVNAYWLTEYNFDGIRYDFTKGFTNTPGDGTAYDASRIAILERMYNAIKTVKPKAYVIIEHFTDNSEEKELANYGLMPWGNINYDYSQATMGWSGNFSNAYFVSRGYTYANLVSYAESHDEERNAYQALTYGNTTQAPVYDVTNKSTYVNRTAATEAFNIFMPGPRKLWQFEELAYDYSINYNTRTGRKPIRWDYFDDPDRNLLYTRIAKMIQYRIQNPTIFKWQIDYYEEPSSSNNIKRIRYIDPDVPNTGRINAVIMGNFGVTGGYILPGFGADGLSWYDVVAGYSIGVQNNTATNQFYLNPGEVRVYIREELSPAYTIRPPLGQDTAFTILENVNRTFSTSDIEYYSVDNRTFSGIKITTLPTAGKLQYNGVDVTLNADYSDVTKFVFTPDLNTYGTTYSTFTYQLKDNSTPSALYSGKNYSVTLNVTHVNVAPVITGQLALSTTQYTPLTITFDKLLVTDPDNTYPTGFSMTIGAGANYTFSGNTITPSINFFGTLTVPVTVNDGLADSQPFNLSVTVQQILFTISGSAGVAGATLSYIDGSAKTATADGSGNYSFAVSYNWSGSVTPSISGYTFSPVNKSYNNVLANQTTQNYSANLNAPVATPATIVVANSFTANWNVVGGATGYYLDVDDNSDFSSPLTNYNNLFVGNLTSFSVTGLSTLVTYYYRVRAWNASYLSQYSNVIAATTVSMTTIWNGTTWVGGVPDITLSAIIAGNYNQNANFVCNNLTINSSTILTINAGNYVTVNGNYTNNGSVILKSPKNGGAAGSLIINGTATGNIGVELWLSANTMHYIASPVTNATTSVFTGAPIIKYYIASSGTWNPASGNYTGALTQGKAYSVTYVTPTTITFNGVPKGGSFEFYSNNLLYNVASIADLGGNPFTSAIDWMALYNLVTTKNISPTISYRISNLQFATYCATTGAQTNGGQRYIPAMQGFSVRAMATSAAVLTATNAVKVNATTVAYMKNDEIVDNSLKLKASGNNVVGDETMILFRADATTGFDDLYDGEKTFVPENEFCHLYSRSSEGLNLAINTLPETQSMDLFFRAGVSGNYNIDLANMNLNNYSTVVLEDIAAGTFTNISNGTYSFAYATGSEKPFRLHFGEVNSAVNKIDAVTQVYSAGKFVYVTNPTTEQVSVSIYDINGKCVFESKTGNGLQRIALNTITGMYLVKISGNSNMTTTKVMIQ